MPETITVYTLDELKDANPGAYRDVHERWKESCCEHSTPWADEALDSAKACIDACGGELIGYEIQPHYGIPYLEVAVDDCDDEDVPEDHDPPFKDANWLWEVVLKPLGYEQAPATCRVSFPGLCPWTGYCFDEDCIEHVYNAMLMGEPLSEALEGLAKLIQRHVEEAIEQHMEEDSMHMNWNDCRFTFLGQMIRCC